MSHSHCCWVLMVCLAFTMEPTLSELWFLQEEVASNSDHAYSLTNKDGDPETVHRLTNRLKQKQFLPKPWNFSYTPSIKVFPWCYLSDSKYLHLNIMTISKKFQGLDNMRWLDFQSLRACFFVFFFSQLGTRGRTGHTLFSHTQSETSLWEDMQNPRENLGTVMTTFDSVIYKSLLQGLQRVKVSETKL